LANTASSEKRNRQTQKRRARNLGVRSALKSALKKAREAIGKGGPEAKKAFDEAARVIYRTASKGVIHKNSAARKVARLAHAMGQTK
jgi:small subunit ribosomal protein S20